MVNDISIMAGIMTIFILIGIALPFINTEFDSDTVTNFDVNNLQNEIGDEAETPSTIGAFEIIISAFSMFFWTFGALPFWLDAVFVILRIVFGITLARNIWPGGGA